MFHNERSLHKARIIISSTLDHGHQSHHGYHGHGHQQCTLDCMISGARYSGVPHNVQVRSVIFLAKPKSVIWKIGPFKNWGHLWLNALSKHRWKSSSAFHFFWGAFLGVTYLFGAIIRSVWSMMLQFIPWGVPPCPVTGFQVSCPWWSDRTWTKWILVVFYIERIKL